MGDDSRMGGSQRGDIFLGGHGPAPKPKGLLDAISEIQQYYVVERSGSPIPKDFFTISGQLAFFEIGVKGGLISGLITALLSPFAIGVVEQYIPIFGDKNPTSFDMVFAFILSLSYTLGYAVFYGSLGRYYIGEVSKAAIKNLLKGLAAGAIFKMFVALIGFHFLFFALEPSRLAPVILKFSGIIKHDTLNAIYVWLVQFRPVFLKASFMVVLSAILMIGIPLIAIIISHNRVKTEMEAEAKWM